MSCAPWQGCTPTADGGRCDSLGLTLAWEAPLAGAPYRPGTNMQLQVRVDGGAFSGGIPFQNAAGSFGTLSGGSGAFAGTTTAGLTDMTYTLTAGWQDGGPTATTTYRVDGTAPRLAAWWEAAPATRAAWWTAAGTEWRRDEAPHVRVCASEAINLATVSMQLGGAGTAMASSTAGACTTAGVAQCNAGFPTEVGCYTADLSQPTLAGLTGAFRLAVAAQDLAGNPTAAPQDGGSVDVTRARWKVRFAGGANGNSITAAPALDDTGVLYVGTASNLYALTPNGEAPTGWTAAGVAVGAVQSVAWGQSVGVPYLYVAYNAAAGGVLEVRSASTGAALAVPRQCPSTGQTYSGLALLDTGGGERSAVGVLNSSGVPGKLCVVRPGDIPVGLNPSLPDAGVDAFDLPAVPNPPNTAINLVAVTAGATTSISFPSNGAVLHKATWAASAVAYGGNQSVSGATSADFFMGVAPTTSAATSFLAGSDNGLKTLYLLGGAVAAVSTSGAVGFPVVKDSASGGLVGVAAGAGKGLRVTSFSAGPSLGATWISTTKPNGFFSAAPVLGEGGWAYAVNYDGAVAARPFPGIDGVGGWEADVTAAPLSLGGVKFGGAPALDCNRPLSGGAGLAGKPGVLYLVSTGGDVVSILVDSPKLDSTAVWPKYQRDATNSGNPGLGLSLNPGCP